MTDTVIKDGEPQAAPVAPPKVRMDRSRPHPTVHGDRMPGDPFAKVMYFQDGIPCDASGYFMFDHPILQVPGPEGDKLRKIAAKKIERQIKIDAKNPPKPVRVASEDDDEDDAETAEEAAEEDDGLLDAVSFESWLRGEQEVEWNDVSQEIARVYKKRIAKIEDAVDFLVKQGICTAGQLRKPFRKYVS
jgi:hypothetical protein